MSMVSALEYFFKSGERRYSETLRALYEDGMSYKDAKALVHRWREECRIGDLKSCRKTPHQENQTASVNHFTIRSK